jgi:hypothetical protein
MDYIYILLNVSFVLMLLYIIGKSIISILKLDSKIPIGILGFLVWLACLSVLTQILKVENISSDSLYFSYIVTTVFLILISIKYINFKINIVDIAYIFVYITIMVYLSIRYTLGEQLGDNVYLFTLVTKNIDTTLLNNFYYGTGLISDSAIISTAKENLTFYHFNSFILYYFYKIKEMFNSDYIPAYLLNMWLIIFYSISSHQH